MVCGTAPTAADVAAALRAPGLLDCTLTLRAPVAEDRAALLASALQAKAVRFDHAALQALLISPVVSAVAPAVLQVLVVQEPFLKMRGGGVSQHAAAAPSSRSMRSMASPAMPAGMGCWWH